ncbi:7798_t:CDS:1, partial [Gigaspora rosea]
IPKNNHTTKTLNNEEDYSISPSRTRRYSIISESDSQTVHSDNLSERSFNSISQDSLTLEMDIDV